MLLVFSTEEDQIAPSKAAFRRSWDAFMAHGSNHSAGAHMLPRIIRRCERERIPYRLSAMPGIGYYIETIDVEEKT
jgi:hypothetical protein